MLFFGRKKKMSVPPPAISAPEAKLEPRAPWRPKSDADRIAEALPRVFQRTHKDFRPTAKGASMDEAAAVPDIWQVQNTISGSLFGWYAAQSFIGHQACAVLAQHWLVAKACGQAPKDAAQNGYRLILSHKEGDAVDEGLQADIEQADQDLAILTHCREAARNSRIFGIRHVLFLVDGVDYAAPFNPDGIKPFSYRGISQIDPYWLAPEFDACDIIDPAAPHFYEPTWWRLPNGQRVHRSHFVILREEEVPDVLKPTYLYGGLPLPQLIYERVYAAERTANEAPELALTKRLTTMTGSLDAYLTDESEVTDRLHAFNHLRSNFGFLVVGEDENITQHDTSLADFDALIMTQYQLVAAIARTPATKLLGTSPKGFNATGEHESASYDQELASIQATALQPVLERHHLLLARSHFAGQPGLVIGAEWAPVRAATPLEEADIRLKQAQAAQAIIAAGVVDPVEERARLRADKTSGYAGLGDLLPDEGDPLDLSDDGAPT